MSGRPARRRPFALSRRGWGFIVAAVALLVVAYWAGSAQVQLAAALALALVLVAVVIAAFRRPYLHVDRTFSPSLVAAGGSATVTLHVRNLARRPTAPTTWRDSLPWPGDATGRLAALTSGDATLVRRGSTTDSRYRIVAPRRGVYSVGPLLVDFDDPFGLAHGTRRVEGEHTLTVTPAVVPLPETAVGFAAGEGTAKLVQHSILGNDDDLMTREYRRGDAMRRIHWRVSARQGELMVRQEEQRAKPELRLIVDTRLDAYSDVRQAQDAGANERSETFEWVVRMVASLGLHLHTSGFDVHVLETARAQIAGFEEGSEQYLASLASVGLVAEPTTLRAPEASISGGLFAILAESDAEVLAWLVRMRRPTERAVAFLPAGATRARDALSAAGWQCVVFRADDDLATVWAAVTPMGVGA
jgi:uncharacterized protein (DUF58 family)